jgi:hypothetical protein
VFCKENLDSGWRIKIEATSVCLRLSSRVVVLGLKRVRENSFHRYGGQRNHALPKPKAGRPRAAVPTQTT